MNREVNSVMGMNGFCRLGLLTDPIVKGLFGQWAKYV